MAPPDPTPAWLAEHVLGWRLPIIPAPLMILRWWTDAEGKPQAPEMFDPLHVPADALRIIDHIREYATAESRCVFLEELTSQLHWPTGHLIPWPEAVLHMRPEHICRAAQAWVLAQEGEHGTGT